MNAIYSDGTKLERQFSENMERVLARTSKYIKFIIASSWT